MTVVLDTHAWVWFAARPRGLSPRARAAVAEATELAVAAVSCLEVAMLVARGRLTLDRDVLEWLRDALRLPKVALVPLTPEIAVRSTRLGPHFPGDPADRLIVATALERGALLLTRDRPIRDSGTVGCVW